MLLKALHTAYDAPPEWAKNAIWYQILVERFYNADPLNDPVLENIKGAWPSNLDETWRITPWTSDWYANAPTPLINYLCNSGMTKCKAEDMEEIFKGLLIN
ncbi:hypothetical protein EQP59_03635 [Ornithobacterium rhinotracheale]|uniref:Uncharacterized protein n=1 Tax=Ornithobacterium rhinotracheale TaxID=28251 RepID=A0A3R5UV78_ORNRH|nr:hypothetical protein [Ornithobacterium rhinotracheale]QAR30509.1 hypothetical protein EQP59_03635 [Ornithobacterium rhinotracheale]